MKYHGILLQLPLPIFLRDQEGYFLDLIEPQKDVDCLTTFNKKQMEKYGDQAYFLPCTVKGVMEMLNEKNINLDGKRVLIVGKGRLTGLPLKSILECKEKNCN